MRGEYGSGKTFFARWLAGAGQGRRASPTAEVQISETETPLHRLETVYRRLIERLSTADAPPGGAARPSSTRWFYVLEEDVLADGQSTSADTDGPGDASRRAAGAAPGRRQPARSDVRGGAARLSRRAGRGRRAALADGLLAWLAGQPNVGAAVKRAAGSRARSTTSARWASSRAC